MTEPDTEPGLEGGSDQPRSPRSPGATLLAERRSQGLSLGDIARQLKLSVRQVEALERDEYGGFSGSVFVRGFLRNYAKLLRLDPDRLLEAAGESIAPVRVNESALPQMPMASPNQEGRHRILSWAAFGVLAVVVLFLLASKEQRDTQPAERALAPAAPALRPGEPPSAAMSQPPSAPMTPAEPVSAVPAPENAAPAAASPIATGTQPSESPVAAESTSSRGTGADALRAGNPPAEESSPAAKPRVLVSGSGASQIRMVFEMDPVEIVNLALLKFGAAPDRRERRQRRTFRPVVRPQPNDDRAVLMRHRVEVVNRLEITGKKFLLRLLDVLFLTLDQLFHFHLFLNRAIEPIDAGHIGAVIEAQGWIIAQETRDGGCVRVIEEKRRLIRRTEMGNDLKFGARNRVLGAGFDLFERFHR
jgi:cytoskeleton protein RodZ